MTSLKDQMLAISIKSLNEIKQQEALNQIAKQQKEDEIMQNITNVYYPLLINCIKHRAEKGHTDAFMNFRCDDNNFELLKANYPGLGFPYDVLVRWLKYISTPNNKYLKDNQDLYGFEFDVFKNYQYTVHISWK